MSDIDQVAEFLAECERYLHSWLCVRKGHYEPYDYQSVHKILLTLLADGSKDVINDFVDGVEMGKIIVSTFAIGLSEEKLKQLYKRHLEITSEFEKKYNL